LGQHRWTATSTHAAGSWPSCACIASASLAALRWCLSLSRLSSAVVAPLVLLHHANLRTIFLMTSALVRVKK
jgi:hypothetical protein